MAVTLDSLKKAVKKNKGRSQALAWLADMERASGDYDAALKTVDEALAASPNDVPALLVRAKILSGKQDFAGSVSEYKKVLAKDPFCLSAHKRMGESYDKLGKTDERNACFRRVHDMDPLDSFWKEEYDVLPEESADTMVAPPMDDSSFTMDMDSEADGADVNGEEDVFANLAASLPNTDEEDSSSMENLLSSLNAASGDISAEPSSPDPSFDNVLSTSEVSSAITGILGGDDDLDASEFLDAKGPEVSVSPFSQLNISDAVPEAEKPSDTEENDAPQSDSTQPSENEFSLDEPAETGIGETDVDDAFASLLGDDDLPSETPAEAEKPLEVAEPAKPVEEKPTNVDDAFSSIFGDDELPEEKTVEPLAEEQALSADESPAEESLGGMFEKSADADFSLNETPAEAEKPLEVAEPAKPEEEKPTNVDDAFASIFGDDELPEEKPVDVTTGPAADVAKDADLNLDEPAEESFGGLFEKSADADFSLNGTPAEAVNPANTAEPAETASATEPLSNKGVPTTHMDFSDDDDAMKSDDFVLDLDSDASSKSSDEFVVEPVSESAAADLSSEKVAAAPAEGAKKDGISEDLSVSVDGAFDALFGEENPVEEKPAAEKDDDVAKEMGGAFASMFGDDEDLALPEEKPTASAPLERSTGSENLSATAAGKTAEAPAEVALSQEATGAEIEEESVKESVGDSFDSIFGKDDDLDLPVEKPAAPVAKPVAVEKPAAVEEPAEMFAEAPSADLDSVDSEVSNAFKGLFDEDDSLAESDAPSNKGVDYLMSGDSDDEVSASLVYDADAPLSRGAADLDDSLNTRTLADIYMEQGVYNKALDIYSDLAKKNPNNAEIKSRLEEVEKLCREKFGEG